MLHNMKLQPEPFEMIKCGQKTYELRLLDTKRQKVSVGDTIEFLNLKNKRDKIRARVVGLHMFDSFSELYATIPLLKCGYTAQNVADANPSDMERYYSKTEQAQWGVVAIELELIKDWRDNAIIKTSRYISLILRHKPEATGIRLDKNGWANAGKLIRGVSKTHLLLMKSTIGEAVGINGSSDEIDLLERRIDALNKRMLDLVSLSVQEGDDAENHEDDFKNISTQIEQLTKRITAIRESESENGDFQARLKEIQDIIDKRRENKDIYDDSIVRQMVECIKVYHDGRLQIILGGGYELEEYLEK